MTFAESFLPEFDNEMKTTRALLERVPFEKADWKPHQKSTALGPLASHLVNLAGYGALIASTDGLDMSARGGAQPQYASTQETIAAFDDNVKKSRDAISGLTDADSGAQWTLRTGDTVLFELPRAAVFRTMMLNHLIHHRGQLSVYLRLNNVPLPSIYGPTADT